MFDHKDIQFIEVIRAISDLSYGIPIILHNVDGKILVVPVERISESSYTKLKALHPNLHLIISKQRASFLSHNTANHATKISCKNNSYDEIQKLVFNLDSKKNYQLDFKNTTTLEEKALSLLQIAELIPAALITEVDHDFHTAFSVNTLNIDNIENYAAHMSDNLEEVSSADLNLKQAEGCIKAFRSQFGKDHYAIIIRSKKSPGDALIPLVRVHSSCFTGDILASIKCDCLDQLQGAIKIMSEENGGIIIYLNQEGRGIGLTNKVRVYHAQSMGFDTVEANENLGLQGDSRGFAIAAKILKSLDIHQINLLSNNPTKAQDLIKEGIEVKDVFPHQFLNDEVKKYYQTKAQKFKHKIDV